MLASLDSNGDGKISFSEFVMGASNKSKLLNEVNLKIAFDVLDLNGDGHISSEEIRQRLELSSLDGIVDLNVEEHFWNRLIESCDSNGDGYISWDEFRENMNKLWTLQSEVDSYIKLDQPTEDESFLKSGD